MKKIEVIFESLYCDICSLEVGAITKEIPEINSFFISRKKNTLLINFENNSSISIENIKNNFEEEGYRIQSIKIKNSAS